MAVERLSLSILVPVYNEQHLVAQSLNRLRALADSPTISRVQVIVVDDGSTDGTSAVLDAYRDARASEAHPSFRWVFLKHPRNCGKGQAVVTALDAATCDVCVVHDADLEYHPHDLNRIVEVFIKERADAVFGSRFAGGGVRRILNYRHELGNRLLTSFCNLVTNLNVTDMETCYKAVRTDLFKSIPLESTDFRFEVELTIKLAKRHARIYEIPISYSGRTYDEGKKISWRDGYRALFAIAKFGASDNVYKTDRYGSQMLGRLSRAHRYNGWLAQTIREFCGNRVLEIGSGVGNITRHLIPRTEYIVSDVNPLYLQALNALTRDRPYLEAAYCDVTDSQSFPNTPNGFDTVICLNVIEHIEDDRAALTNIKRVLADNGRAIILVPQGQWNFGTLDEVLEHKRRYSKETLRELAAACGMRVTRLLELNRIGTIAWFLNGKLLRRRTFGLLQIQMLNCLTPLFRAVDFLVPLPAISLIAIMERQPEEMATEELSMAALDGNHGKETLRFSPNRNLETGNDAPAQYGDVRR
jgi:glycosyltransferase involved in cell wall biosynthesis